jgi:hypothetical protein
MSRVSPFYRGQPEPHPRPEQIRYLDATVHPLPPSSKTRPRSGKLNGRRRLRGSGAGAGEFATVRLESGPNAGEDVRLQLNPSSGPDPNLDPGDEIRVARGADVRPGTERAAGTGLHVQ